LVIDRPSSERAGIARTVRRRGFASISSNTDPREGSRPRRVRPGRLWYYRLAVAANLHGRRRAAAAAGAEGRTGGDMADKTEREQAQKLIAENRKAYHDYHIFETFEAGIALVGTEVKAIREGRANLRDSFGRVENSEIFVFNVHISPYSHRGYAEHDPLRKRKLLLHRQEIRKLIGKTTERGMTLVPLRLYFKNGRVKLALGLAKGKKEHDRRETIRRREADRETRAAVKERRNRGE
jgi:SsrA-binding protein